MRDLVKRYYVDCLFSAPVEQTMCADPVVLASDYDAIVARLAAELAAERRISLMRATQRDALQAQVAGLEATIADRDIALSELGTVRKRALEFVETLRRIDEYIGDDDKRVRQWCHDALAGPTRNADQPAVLLTDEDHLYRWEVTPFPYGKEFDVYVTDDDHEALEAAKDALEQAWDTTEPGKEFTVRVKFNGPDRNAIPTTAEGTEK